MIRRIGHVSVVNDKSSPSINCLEAAAELASKHVFRGVAQALHGAFGHVVKKRVIGESAFQLRLPDMVMRVDEARRHSLACAVDYLGLRTGRGNGGADLLYDVAFNQDIGVAQG